MTEVLAMLYAPHGPPQVREVAAAMAAIMHADLTTTRVHRGRDVAGAVLRELDRPTVALGVLARDQPPPGTVWQVAGRCAKPLVVVPPRTGERPFTGIARVLLPLDGSPQSAAAVADTVAVLTGAGVDLVVAHVFDRSTVPAFWDQAAHTGESWQEEFVSRFCPQPRPRLRLRSGVAADHVLDLAAAEGADLITMAWSQRLEAGRARTVRRAVADSTIPLMLVPLPGG